MHDVLDGYYPSEFRDDFPDGVVFNITDRRGERYQDGRAGGAGAPLSSGMGPVEVRRFRFSGGASIAHARLACNAPRPRALYWLIGCCTCRLPAA